MLFRVLFYIIQKFNIFVIIYFIKSNFIVNFILSSGHYFSMQQPLCIAIALTKIVVSKFFAIAIKFYF